MHSDWELKHILNLGIGWRPCITDTLIVTQLRFTFPLRVVQHASRCNSAVGSKMFLSQGDRVTGSGLSDKSRRQVAGLWIRSLAELCICLCVASRERRANSRQMLLTCLVFAVLSYSKRWQPSTRLYDVITQKDRNLNYHCENRKPQKQTSVCRSDHT
jgi:hypothetical protein